MVKKEVVREVVEEVIKEKESSNLIPITKEMGIGLKMPDGTTLNLSQIDPAMAAWMGWATITLDEIKRNLVGE